jgi:hypothetical protein
VHFKITGKHDFRDVVSPLRSGSITALPRPWDISRRRRQRSEICTRADWSSPLGAPPGVRGDAARSIRDLCSCPPSRAQLWVLAPSRHALARDQFLMSLDTGDPGSTARFPVVGRARSASRWSARRLTAAARPTLPWSVGGTYLARSQRNADNKTSSWKAPLPESGERMLCGGAIPAPARAERSRYELVLFVR